jgi:FkbM family methyltransferase
MKIVRVLQKFILFVFCLFRHRSFKLAYYLAFYNTTLDNINSIRKKGDFIYFPNNNILNIHILNKFAFTINLLFKLVRRENAIIETSNSSYFIINIEGLKFKVASLSNMAVLYEIFVQKLYEVGLYNNDVVVIDIGMNVGVASLYFANNSSVKAVYAYEPFPETYKEALNNFILNPKVSSKIIPFNLGISNSTCSRTIALYDSGVLSASTIENNDNYGKVMNKEISVNMLSIIDLMSKVHIDFPLNKLVLKIDCEGEEYGIFDMLKTTNYLDKVDCILLEWHEKGVESLAAILKSNGFQYFHAPNDKLESGMLYSFRLN